MVVLGKGALCDRQSCPAVEPPAPEKPVPLLRLACLGARLLAARWS